MDSWVRNKPEDLISVFEEGATGDGLLGLGKEKLDIKEKVDF